MEVSCVNLILVLSRLNIVLESPEVFLAELGLGSRLETLVKRRLLALVVLCVDGSAGRLGERLAVEVLGLDLRYVTLVAWDVLSLQVLCGAAQPVFTFLRVVSISNVCALFVDSGRLRVVLTSGVGWLSNRDVDIVVAGLVACSHDDSVNVTGCASVHLVLFRSVPSVARQVLFLVVYLCHAACLFSVQRLLQINYNFKNQANQE